MRQRKDSAGRYRPRNVSVKAYTGHARTEQVEWASDVQRQVFEYGPAPICASGGWGAGKTRVLALKALLLSEMYPGNRGLIGRKVWTELQRSTMETFFKVCPPQAYRFGKRADTEKILQLNNGSEILWMHLDSAETEGVIRGLEINWFFIDQAEEIDEEIFDLLCARLGRWDKVQVPQQLIDGVRATGEDWAWWNTADGKYREGAKAMPPPYAMLACNPDTTLHWIYRRFHEESPHHDAKHIHDEESGELRSFKDLGYRMFHMPSLENKFLSRTNRDQLNAKDKSFRDRFRDAKWGISEGTIHVVDPLSEIPGDPAFVEKLIRTCSLHRVLDHGESAPTACGWYAVDGHGNVIFFREYYRPGATIDKHRAKIWELGAPDRFAGDDPYETSKADPQIFKKEHQKAGGHYALADEWKNTEPPYVERDAIYWTRADNNELVIRDRINQYLEVDPLRPHPYTGQLGAPRLFFVMRSPRHPYGCHHMVQQVKQQRRIRIGIVDGQPTFADERDESIEDHGYDLVRYGLGSRPGIGSAIVVPQASGPNSLAAVMDAHRRDRAARSNAPEPGQRLRSRWR